MLPPPPSPSLTDLSTPALRTLLEPISATSGPLSIFTNWASTFFSQSKATFRPRNVEEVRWVVELARREGIELRPSGSGHSPSDIVCTDGYVVNIDAVKEVLEVSHLFPSFGVCCAWECHEMGFRQLVGANGACADEGAGTCERQTWRHVPQSSSKVVQVALWEDLPC